MSRRVCEAEWKLCAFLVTAKLPPISVCPGFPSDHSTTFATQMGFPPVQILQLDLGGQKQLWFYPCCPQPSLPAELHKLLTTESSRWRTRQKTFSEIWKDGINKAGECESKSQDKQYKDFFSLSGSWKENCLEMCSVDGQPANSKNRSLWKRWEIKIHDPN